jgi:1-acyl-sn-glycerol-3-phosphate acyltransferase
MLQKVGKFLFMVKLGYQYIRIFRKTYYHPFISQKPAYRKLSQDRQAYSNAVLQFLNIEVQLIGKFPEKDKILYAVNHRSLLDIIVMEHLFSRYDKSGVWIAKQELLDAFYGDFFRYSGCVSVDLENGKGLLKFFKQIKHTLSKVDDINIYIFPEGERYKKEGITEFQSGAAKIAKANKLDVVPVFVNDTLESVFKNAPYKETKKVQVHVGDIITHHDLENDYRHFMKKAKGYEVE